MKNKILFCLRTDLFFQSESEVLYWKCVGRVRYNSNLENELIFDRFWPYIFIRKLEHINFPKESAIFDALKLHWMKACNFKKSIFVLEQCI